MELRILCKHLVANELNGRFTVGENSADIVGITLPRYYEQHDLSQFSFRITAAGKCKNAAVQILEMDNIDEKSVHLLWTVTSDFTAIPEEFTLILTGVNDDNSVTIKFKSCPISVNSDKSWEFMPSPELSEQLLNQTHNEIQKAIDAAKRAEIASQTPAPAEVYPATAEGLGGIKSGGDISVSDDGTVTVLNSENLKNEIAELKSLIGFSGNDILGLHADFENNIFTRLAGAVGLNGGSDFDKFSMYGGRRRCNVLDDGTITAYYGDNNFAEDGSNGQVMVYQPKFYYKVVPLKLEPITDGMGYHLRNANYYISETPKSGFKLHPAFYDENGEPVDYILFSAYEGSIFDVSENVYLENNEQIADFNADKLSSIAGVKPSSGNTQNLTRANIELLAKNRGIGWHSDTIKAESANQILMAIEYSSFNSQSVIGNGITEIQGASGDNSVITGTTSAIGNSTGCVVGTDSLSAISYRGVENMWGNVNKFVNGINIYGNGALMGGIPYICSDFVFSENKKDYNYLSAGFTIANVTNYVSAFGYSQRHDWLFMPSETNGDRNFPIGDKAGVAPNVNGYKTVSLSEGWSARSSVGAFNWVLNAGVTGHYSYVGSRLTYTPMSKEP